jgi:hypothetical protein
MRRAVVCVFAYVLLGLGCSSASQDGLVAFGSHVPIGRWQNEAGVGATLPPAAGGGAASPVVPTGGNGAAGRSLPTGGAAAGAGQPGLPLGGSLASGSGGRGSAAGSGAAGTGGGAGASTGPVSPTSLAFDVLTAPQGGQYQPRNIGAIWVQDGNGAFMKSLEVWAGIRGRYLSKYAAARGNMPVDVVGSATLSSHRTHHANWNMKDRSGAAAPSGKYTVFIEVTDADRTGKFAAVDFDTSAAPQTISPPDAQYFSAMKLQLQ